MNKKYLLPVFIGILGTLLGSPPVNASTGKVLIVLSGSDHVTLQNGKIHPTGFFLPELAIPSQALEAAGFELVFANPNGAKAAMDVLSDDVRWFSSDAELRQAEAWVNRHDGIRSPVRLSLIRSRELRTFDAIFIPGGHAPMEDLGNNRDLGRILNYFHRASKVTAMICHGPVALLSTALTSRGFAYADYSVTAFSTAEEKQEESPLILGGQMKFYLEDALRNSGARVTVSQPWTSSVVQDRELLTGQNPQSLEVFVPALLKMLTGA